MIDASANILLTMHEGMDGDMAGASVGAQLESMGKNITSVIKRHAPKFGFCRSHKIAMNIYKF